MIRTLRYWNFYIFCFSLSCTGERLVKDSTLINDIIDFFYKASKLPVKYLAFLEPGSHGSPSLCNPAPKVTNFKVTAGRHLEYLKLLYFS